MAFSDGEAAANAYISPETNGQSARSLSRVAFTMTQAAPLSGTEGIAIHDPGLAEPCRVNVVAGGHQWIAPHWSDDSPASPRATARWKAWRSQPEFDLAEWSVSTASVRQTRTVFLLRGRCVALFAVQSDGTPGSRSMTLTVPQRVQAHPSDVFRGVVLRRPGTRAAVRILPLGLPSLPYESERGGIVVEGTSIRVTQAAQAKKSWIPLLLSWHPKRDQQPIHWRPLTISEARKVCQPGTAFAVRVGWKGEPYSLVIYRSLARPATRCFLGYQTDARFLIALFGPEGEMKPIVTLGDES